MYKLSIIFFLVINLFADLNVTPKLLKDGTQYNLSNNDIVFENDNIRFQINSDIVQMLKISYQVNSESKKLLRNVELQKDEVTSFPKDDQYLKLDSQSGKLTFFFKTETDKRIITLFTNPKVISNEKSDSLVFKQSDEKIYINQSKVISNHRGAKEANVIIPALEKSTVVVNTNGVIGTGIIINAGKQILTNYHVVEPNENNIYIALKPEIGDNPSKNNYYKANLLKVNMNKDLALLEMPKTLEKQNNISSLKLGNIKEIKKGIDIYTMGHPHKYYFAFEYGMLNKIMNDFNWITYNVDYALQYSMNSNRGNSGGAIINDKLELLGIVAGSDNSGNNLNFGISILDIKNFLKAKESVRVEKRSPDSYKDKIVQQGLYKNIRFAKLDRDGNGKYDAMMKDIDKDGVWDIIAYDTDEDGSYERVTSY